MPREFVRIVDVPVEVRMKAAASLHRDKDAKKILGLAVFPPYHLGRWINTETVHPSVREWLEVAA